MFFSKKYVKNKILRYIYTERKRKRLCFQKFNVLLLVLVHTEAEADGHRVDQSASIKLWFEFSYWLMQSLFASATSTHIKPNEMCAFVQCK